jgi:hypothetical protein
MGCGLVFEPDPSRQMDVRDSRPVVVYFTRNGEVVHFRAVVQPQGGFYPSIGFSKEGELVVIYTY